MHAPDGALASEAAIDSRPDWPEELTLCKWGKAFHYLKDFKKNKTNYSIWILSFTISRRGSPQKVLTFCTNEPSSLGFVPGPKGWATCKSKTEYSPQRNVRNQALIKNQLATEECLAVGAVNSTLKCQQFCCLASCNRTICVFQIFVEDL